MFCITIEQKSSCDTFFLRYCKNIIKFLFWELWTCLTTYAKVKPACRTFDVYLDAKEEFTNYRLISILPVISKTLEKCVYAQVINHLESHKLLSLKQFVFRKKWNTEFANVLFLTLYD